MAQTTYATLFELFRHYFELSEKKIKNHLLDLSALHQVKS